jgi:hypothetical protein
MAEGGWIYAGVCTGVHSGSNPDVAGEVEELKSSLVALLAAKSTGWSLHAAVTAYASNQCWWFALQHTSGARVVIVRSGDYVVAGNIIHADNDGFNITRTVFATENSVYLAYLQPSVSAVALVGNPDASGFLPVGSLRFLNARAYEDVGTDPGPNGYHVMVRGGDMIFAISYGLTTNPDINTVACMGECLDRLVHASHPSTPDTGVDAKYAHVQWDDCNYTGFCNCQFFDVEHYGRIANLHLYYSEILTNNVCDREPFTWQVPLFYVSSSNLEPRSVGGDGVVQGNGLKGYMNPEWMRYTNFPDGPANNKQRMSESKFIYLRAGISVGWDPSNGEML